MRFWKKIQWLIIRKCFNKKLSDLDNMATIQSSLGNRNYSPYMFGMANGLLLAQSLFNNNEFEPLDPPKFWLSDKETKVIKTPVMTTACWNHLNHKKSIQIADKLHGRKKSAAKKGKSNR